MAEIKVAVTAKLICAFGFAYANCLFTYEAAHLLDKYTTVHYVLIRFELLGTSCIYMDFFLQNVSLH